MRIRKNGPEDASLHDEEILNASKISDALAHPVRIRMLRYILKENLDRHTVTNKDLVLAFDYAQATISQHLTKLVIGGLIEVRKAGTSSCYYARIGRLTAYIETLKKIDFKDGIGDEMPSFLRTKLFESGSSDDELQGELHPEDFVDIGEDDSAPRYL